MDRHSHTYRHSYPYLIDSGTPLTYDPIYKDKKHPSVTVTKKRSVDDLEEADLRGKRVLVRVELNDSSEIPATAPTIQYLINHRARVILCGHLGGHGDEVTPSSLRDVTPVLSQVIGTTVVMASGCIGEEVEEMVAALQDGDIVLLENVRMYKEEVENGHCFAEKLASLADLYVNDAFQTTSLAHTSTLGVTKFLRPAVAGLTMKKELDYLVGVASHPSRPFAAIVGGSKLSSKWELIEALLDKVDILLLGGEMIFTFYKAQGCSVGSSLVEEHMFDLAMSILKKAKDKKVELIIPNDVLISRLNTRDTEIKQVSVHSIPNGWRGVDIGSCTIYMYACHLAVAKTILWIGAMGASNISIGTEAVAKLLAELSDKGATTVVAEGVSIASLERLGVADKMSHISRGGVTTTALLQGSSLPSLLALDDAV
ncbi:phosphoglycerate kinase, cytosolic-like [Papaver somniferum]|uniref:phosphoglycerate kinase, cytosolic-like n=1 Tax=Papaver somniferum TaxID=3469 RepID=UPI000E6FDAFF|nr:phosphoglycerate kinase, cytosolic-like [Papaver somniferum]